jgi:hypothetical protein
MESCKWTFWDDLGSAIPIATDFHVVYVGTPLFALVFASSDELAISCCRKSDKNLIRICSNCIKSNKNLIRICSNWRKSDKNLIRIFSNCRNRTKIWFAFVRILVRKQGDQIGRFGFIRRLLTLVTFLKITEVGSPYFFATLFHDKSYVLFVTKIGCQIYYFGPFFHKLIWSPFSQVSSS